MCAVTIAPGLTVPHLYDKLCVYYIRANHTNITLLYKINQFPPTAYLFTHCLNFQLSQACQLTHWKASHKSKCKAYCQQRDKMLSANLEQQK